MKILCPDHNDTNPSMEVYETYAHCFSCGSRRPLHEVLDDDAIAQSKPEPEDINEAIKRIIQLPVRKIRCLEFPVDNQGYYVLWQNALYYKKRLFRGSGRYLGPRGHSPPLFSFQADKKVLVLVEGEINAMSIRKVFANSSSTIASPGSAPNFIKYLDDYLQFDSIFIVADYDEPGIKNGAKLRDELISRKKRVRLTAWSTDANELLVTKGKEAVEEKCKAEDLAL